VRRPRYGRASNPLEVRPITAATAWSADRAGTPQQPVSRSPRRAQARPASPHTASHRPPRQSNIPVSAPGRAMRAHRMVQADAVFAVDGHLDPSQPLERVLAPDALRALTSTQHRGNARLGHQTHDTRPCQREITSVESAATRQTSKRAPGKCRPSRRNAAGCSCCSPAPPAPAGRGRC